MRGFSQEGGKNISFLEGSLAASQIWEGLEEEKNVFLEVLYGMDWQQQIPKDLAIAVARLDSLEVSQLGVSI